MKITEDALECVIEGGNGLALSLSPSDAIGNPCVIIDPIGHIIGNCSKLTNLEWWLPGGYQCSLWVNEWPGRLYSDIIYWDHSKLLFLFTSY